MEVEVYNQTGEKTGKLELSPAVFGAKLSKDLVFQVALAQMANLRKPIAHSKNRAEVSGGGKKPWAQKGTGRARQGSIRSPLWKGGGAAFGPRNERVYKQKVNKKMAKLALFQLLSEKARQNLLLAVEPLSLAAPKTKLFTSFLEKLPLKEKRTLLVLPQAERSVVLAAKNIPWMNTKTLQTLSASDILSSHFIIFDKTALDMLQKPKA